MKLKDIMATDLITITPQDSIQKAAQLMRDNDIGCLVAVEGRQIRGIITDRDIVVRCLSEGSDSWQVAVSPYLTNEVITGTPDMDLLDAAALLAEHEIKRLPVVDGGEIEGIVTYKDINVAMHEILHDLYKSQSDERAAEVAEQQEAPEGEVTKAA